MNQEETKFWEDVVSLLEINKPIEIEYRLYYNQLGEVFGASMIAQEKLSDLYIVVAKDEYEQYFDYRVVDGKLKKIDRDSGYYVQLEKSDKGYCVVKNHAGLLVEPEETYITTEYYAHRNN